MSDDATISKIMRQINKPENPIFLAVACLHLIKEVEKNNDREEFCLLGCTKHSICIARTATQKIGVMTKGTYRWTDR